MVEGYKTALNNLWQDIKLSPTSSRIWLKEHYWLDRCYPWFTKVFCVECGRATKSAPVTLALLEGNTVGQEVLICYFRCVWMSLPTSSWKYCSCIRINFGSEMRNWGTWENQKTDQPTPAWCPPCWVWACSSAVCKWTSPSRACRSHTGSRETWLFAPTHTNIDRTWAWARLHGNALPPLTCTGWSLVLVLPMPSTVVTAAPWSWQIGRRQALAERCLMLSEGRCCCIRAASTDEPGSLVNLIDDEEFCQSEAGCCKDTWWFWSQVDSVTAWPCTRHSLRLHSHTWFPLASLKSEWRKTCRWH